MKLLYILGLIAFVQAGGEPNNLSGRIVTGQPSFPTDNFVFRVLSVENDETMWANISSGVAITENFGLVVAQAIFGFKFWYIGYNSINTTEQLTQSIDRQNIQIHADYNPETLHNNIAVIKFTNPVSNYLPVASGPSQFPILVALGYGFSDREDTVLPEILQHLILWQLSDDICESSYTEYNRNTSICGGFPVQSQLSDGDQGGAVTDSTRTTVHGVVSHWGNANDSPVVIVDIITYTDFIEQSKEELSQIPGF